MVVSETNAAQDERVEAAAAWLARLRSDACTTGDERRFEAWLEADPENRAAFAGVSGTFDRVGDAGETPELLALRRQALQRPNPAVRLAAAAPRRSAAVLALAACLVLAVFAAAGGAGWLISQPDSIYRTAAGERSTVTLQDGTLVTLTSNSVVTAEFTTMERRVRLDRGQAYFDVIQDPGRPFIVEAGGGQVTALGTIFDVYKKNGEVVVTLVEGAVRVAAGTAASGRPDRPPSVELEASEQVSFEYGQLSPVREVKAANVVSWREGILVVDEQPLIDVVDDYNRHSRTKLIVDRDDPVIRQITVNAFFRTGNPNSLIEWLEDNGYRVNVTVDSSGNSLLTIRKRTSQGR